MSNEILNSLLQDYSQKKIKAEIDLEIKKENLYKKYPRLQEIENELNNFAISTAKNILNNNPSSIELSEVLPSYILITPFVFVCLIKS